LTIVKAKQKKIQKARNSMDKNTMEQKAREMQREYQRQWRKKNPDKVREKNRRYWVKKAREQAEKGVD